MLDDLKHPGTNKRRFPPRFIIERATTSYLIKIGRQYVELLIRLSEISLHPGCTERFYTRTEWQQLVIFGWFFLRREGRFFEYTKIASIESGTTSYIDQHHQARIAAFIVHTTDLVLQYKKEDNAPAQEPAYYTAQVRETFVTDPEVGWIGDRLAAELKTRVICETGSFAHCERFALRLKQVIGTSEARREHNWLPLLHTASSLHELYIRFN